MHHADLPGAPTAARDTQGMEPFIPGRPRPLKARGSEPRIRQEARRHAIGGTARRLRPGRGSNGSSEPSPTSPNRRGWLRLIPAAPCRTRSDLRTPIGTGGFEPPTPATQRRCATRLRHVPGSSQGSVSPCAAPDRQRGRRAVALRGRRRPPGSGRLRPAGAGLRGLGRDRGLGDAAGHHAGRLHERLAPLAGAPWFLLLAGELEVETGGGETRRVSAGDAVLVEDVTGPGHRTRVVGDAPAHAAFIRLAG